MGHGWERLQPLYDAQVYSQALLAHFKEPRNTGELPPPAVTVEASNPVCGDTLRLSVEWVDRRIAKVAYKARGCTAAVAAGSALTELLAGRTAQEAFSITARQIEQALDGLPAASGHAAILCVDAIKAMLRASDLK
jgi:nitrogen fixation NifU-like protein